MRRLRYGIVGSAHIDIIASVNPDAKGIDKRGNITLSIGGTAFNVASGLSALKGYVDFFSVFKAGSLFTRIILTRISELGFTLHIEQKDITDAGFISVRKGNDMLFAVNSTPIEYVTLDSKMYKNILTKCDAIVVDLNNSIDTIKNFLDLSWLSCESYLKGVYLLGVSEEKVLKLLALQKRQDIHHTIRGIFLNRFEARSLLEAIGSSNYTDLCNIIDTLWIVTADIYGVMLFYKGKLLRYVDSPSFTRVLSYEGSGDAFAAGFIHTHVVEGELELCIENGYKLVRECVKYNHSNTVSENLIDRADGILFRDALTGLYNRVYLEEQLDFFSSFAAREGKPISVIIFDLDKFKNINDTYGHAAGDEVLKTFGRIIVDNIRKSDIAARYGGEEIVVVSPGIGKKGAYMIAERIRKKLEKIEILYNGTTIRVTSSAGVSSGYENVRVLLEKADKALYEAKNNGRNRVSYSSA